MKIITVIFGLLLLTSVATAQQKDSLSSNEYNSIYTAVEKEPTFPGGIAKFYTYFSESIRGASANSGKEIKSKLLVEMIVEKDGSLSHVKILKSISPEVDKQAIDALMKSPKWVPGTINNKPVRVRYQFPVIIDWAAE